MDLKKVAIIKPARGNYDAGTTYAYHSETLECVLGVVGGALTGGGGTGVALRVLGASMGPVGWGLVAVMTIGGAATGYAEYC